MSNEPTMEMPYVDRPEVQEVYADQVRLIHFDGYSVRLEFAVVRPRIAGPDRAERMRPGVPKRTDSRASSRKNGPSSSGDGP